VFQVYIFTSLVRFTVTFGTNRVCILRNNAQHHRATFSRVCPNQQEAQLILTNLRDAFIGQSRSPNIAPFHMLGIVSRMMGLPEGGKKF